MLFKDRIKVFKRDLARAGLYASTSLIKNLPFNVVRWLTRVFIAVGYLFIVRQRKIARESLQIAFGRDKSEREIRTISRGCFENLGKGMIELIYFMEHPWMIKDQVSFKGREHLDRALAAGKGVIGVSAHFGSFPLMLLHMAQEGYPTNAIIRQTRDLKVEEYFQNLRTRLGLKTIYSHPRQSCVSASIAALRRNEFLFIPLDQNFGSAGGVFVDFFGQKAATATGPVIFAMRTGSPILPVFIVRQEDDRHTIVVEPPLFLEEKGNDQETVVHNTSRITQVIERYIRIYPQEWGWMHRRWKTRPAEETLAPQPAIDQNKNAQADNPDAFTMTKDPKGQEFSI